MIDLACSAMFASPVAELDVFKPKSGTYNHLRWSINKHILPQTTIPQLTIYPFAESVQITWPLTALWCRIRSCYFHLLYSITLNGSCILSVGPQMQVTFYQSLQLWHGSPHFKSNLAQSLANSWCTYFSIFRMTVWPKDCMECTQDTNPGPWHHTLKKLKRSGNLRFGILLNCFDGFGKNLFLLPEKAALPSGAWQKLS